MTTYADFQAYYLRKVWRTGDLELTQDLPMLIKEAEARIKRDFRDNSLANTVQVITSFGNEFPLPASFRELISASVNGRRLLSALPMEQLHRTADDQNGSISDHGNYYSLLGGSIFTRGFATAGNPGILSLTYYMDLVPYADQPDPPFFDEYPDFYIAALNVVVYDYLREFELKGQNEQAYQTALDSMIRNSNYARWPSGQIAMALPR